MTIPRRAAVRLDDIIADVLRTEIRKAPGLGLMPQPNLVVDHLTPPLAAAVTAAVEAALIADGIRGSRFHQALNGTAA